MLNYGPAVLIIFSVFVGILLNRRDYTLLREDMNRRFAELYTYINQRFEQVDQRFAQVDQRFAQVDQRFAQVDQRFEQVNRQFEEVHRRLILIENDQKQFFHTTGIIDGRLDELSSRIK